MFSSSWQLRFNFKYLWYYFIVNMSNSWKLGNMRASFGNLLKLFWPLKLCVNGFAAKNYGFYTVMTWKLSIFYSTVKVLFHNYYHYHYYLGNYTWFCEVCHLTCPLLHIIWTKYEKCHNRESSLYFKKLTIWAYLKKKSCGIYFVT